MKLQIFSIYDKAAQVYNRPIFAPTVGMAARMFEDECLREESDIGKHPEDYVLFQIGSFDDQTSDLIDLDPVVIGRAHEIISAKRNEK